MRACAYVLCIAGSIHEPPLARQAWRRILAFSRCGCMQMAAVRRRYEDAKTRRCEARFGIRVDVGGGPARLACWIVLAREGAAIINWHGGLWLTLTCKIQMPCLSRQHMHLVPPARAAARRSATVDGPIAPRSHGQTDETQEGRGVRREGGIRTDSNCTNVGRAGWAGGRAARACRMERG